jgi:phosphate transport system permease protein
MATRVESVTSTEVVRQHLHGRRVDVRGLLFEGALLMMLLIAFGFLLILLYDSSRLGVSVLVERPMGFLTGGLSTFTASTAGVGQAIRGSFMLMVIVGIVAFPLGVGAAVYLEEYARDTRFNRFITVNIRNLAGVPSIVYGLLGLAIFATLLADVTGGRRSLLAAGLTLAILVLPIMIITASEALRAVPSTIREAGFGVGASKWQVIRSHVLPSAAPGILTGMILSISRALGETAPLLVVGVATGFLATGGAGFFEQLTGPYTALPTVVYRWATLPSEAFRELTSAAIIVLLGVTLLINAVAIVLRNRYERKW